MAEKIYTNNLEEMFIDRVRRDGFGYKSPEFSDNDFPKYLVLRIAFARAIQCPKIPLKSPQWQDKQIIGDKTAKRGEYFLSTLTGKGKDKKDDFDIAFRAMLYTQHKDELDRDIFIDDDLYLETLSKYIKRGLFELQNSWKNNDSIYQWCLDNLGFDFVMDLPNATSETKQESSKANYFERLQKYFRQFAINIQLINEEDSYRHHICKIELMDSDKISAFKVKAKYLDDEFGTQVMIESCEGISRGYNIQIPKPQEQWQNLGFAEFKAGLAELKKRDFKLGIYAGNDIDKKALYFDLANAPHCFVAGATNSGKTKFIQTMIVCLLQNPNVEITMIDQAKDGFDFKIFTPKIRLITDLREVSDCLDEKIAEMESRFTQMSEAQSDDIVKLGLRYQVIIIDELKDLIDQENKKEKELSAPLGRLAQKARQAGIHLVLGTQRPDSASFSGILRSNIPSRIALKVQKSTESKIILDESGAEKLLGSGDMLVKVGAMSRPKRLFGAKLSDDEIKDLI